MSNIGRYIVDVINRLFDACIGIHSIVSTNTFKEPVNSIARKVFTTIKTHVFQKMSQATLIVFFLQTTHALSQIETRSILRPVIALYIVCQAIRQDSDFNC